MHFINDTHNIVIINYLLTRPILRKKALQCLYSMILKDPSLIVQVEANLFNCLKDSDPGVVWTAIEIYLIVSKVAMGAFS